MKTTLPLLLCLLLPSFAHADDLVDLAATSGLPDVKSDYIVERAIRLRSFLKHVRAKEFDKANPLAMKLLREGSPEGRPDADPWVALQEIAPHLPLEIAEAWVTAHSDSSVALLMRAEARLIKGNRLREKSPEEATKLFTSALTDVGAVLTQEPKLVWAHARRITLHRALGRAPELADPVILAARAACPDNFQVLLEVLQYWRARQDADKVNALIRSIQKDGQQPSLTVCRFLLRVHLLQVRRVIASTRDPKQRRAQAMGYMKKVSQQIGQLLQLWVNSAPRSPDPYHLQLEFLKFSGQSQQQPQQQAQQMLKVYSAAAQRGSPMAQAQVARTLLSQNKLPADDPRLAQAVRLATASAIAGNADGCAEVGRALVHGRGVTAKAEQGIRWLTISARQGNVFGLSVLAECLRTGRGAAKDLAQARKLHGQAAHRGNVSSLYLLGVMFYRGEGGPQDFKRAAQVFQRASQMGHPVAMAWLGEMLLNGKGMAPNPAKALQVLQHAARRGYAPARDMIKKIYEKHPELDPRGRQPGGSGAPPPPRGP